MSCALTSLNKLQGVPLIDSAKMHLALAVAKSKEYDETWHSIFWNSSNEVTKKRVREQLNNLAFDTCTELLACGSLINQYVEEVQETSSPPSWWQEMILDLNLAYEYLERENKQEISARQLILF